MQADVVELEEFYRSRLGRYVTDDLEAALAGRMPSTPPDLVVGFGFAEPLLAGLVPATVDRLALVPAQIGVASSSNTPQVLCQRELLPLRDHCVRGVLMMHLLEFSSNPRAVLREVWRTLQDDGCLIVVVPHRAGLWARTPGQPFGRGTPYSHAQLSTLLTENGFEPRRISHRLSFPPFVSPRLQTLIPTLQRVKILQPLSGVLVAEAQRSVLRPTLVGRVLKIPETTRQAVRAS